jgi:hypothetical protein
LQECFETLLKAKKSLVNDFEHQFNLSCEIAGREIAILFAAATGKHNYHGSIYQYI